MGQGIIRLMECIREDVRCPRCRAPVDLTSIHVTCLNSRCGAVYPVRNGVPVLIDDSQSLFSVSDYDQVTSATREVGFTLLRRLSRRLPEISKNPVAHRNYRALIDLVRQRSNAPRVLILGGRVLGEGAGAVIDAPDVTFVETDLHPGPRTVLICDAHEIPFVDGCFDAVIIQAVLEHVVDPYRCVSEIHRVLTDRGVVYAETPFIQQVHAGPYDYTRFTHLGHRRLFRWFREIDSGPVGGPGMALAWTAQYFLLAFVTSYSAQRVVSGISRLLLFWLKHVDGYLAKRPGAFDSAPGYYFLGEKSDKVLSDRELVRMYRGIQ